jgi:DNA transformation protein and related proteins
MARYQSLDRRSAVTGNLGKVSWTWLRAVGIADRDALAELGALEAYERVRAAGYGPSLNFLWACQAELLGIRWLDLPEPLKAELRAALQQRHPPEPSTL